MVKGLVMENLFWLRSGTHWHHRDLLTTPTPRRRKTMQILSFLPGKLEVFVRT